MKKIAITGASNKNRLILCTALSYLTSYDVIRCVPYSGFALKYGLSKNQEQHEWHDLYSYALQSFVERVEVESSYDEFISNGSVLNELAYMEAKEFMKKKRNRSKDYSFMIKSLKSVITEYAAKKYDCIIHLTNSSQEIGGVYPVFDKCLKDLIKSCNVKSYFHEENTFTEVLENFFMDINLQAEISPATAIKKAELEMLIQ